jgi:uncharacterized membrane protein
MSGVISAWWALAVGAVVVLGYELRVIWIGRRMPHRVARAAHARLRAEWVRTLAERPGFEIVAVQTLRNSLMSATITASTAALCLMGAMSMAGSRLAAGIAGLQANEVSPMELLEILLMATLFASFVCSSLSMRYYHHVGFAMSLPSGTAQREAAIPLAVDYVERAGYLYGWGLRSFLAVAPLVAGIVNPMLFPFACLGLIWVLWQFDKPGAVG